MFAFFKVQNSVKGIYMDEKDEAKKTNVKREGWSAEEVAEEATGKEPDEIAREIARGKEENKINADDRDIAGGPIRNETPHGREETKKQ